MEPGASDPTVESPSTSSTTKSSAVEKKSEKNKVCKVYGLLLLISSTTEIGTDCDKKFFKKARVYSSYNIYNFLTGMISFIDDIRDDIMTFSREKNNISYYYSHFLGGVNKQLRVVNK